MRRAIITGISNVKDIIEGSCEFKEYNTEYAALSRSRLQ